MLETTQPIVGAKRLIQFNLMDFPSRGKCRFVEVGKGRQPAEKNNTTTTMKPHGFRGYGHLLCCSAGIEISGNQCFSNWKFTLGTGSAVADHRFHGEIIPGNHPAGAFDSIQRMPDSSFRCAHHNGDERRDNFLILTAVPV